MEMRSCFCSIVIAASLMLFTTTGSLAYEKGDIDSDGVVRLADALLVLRHVAGTQRLGYIEVYNCDVAGGEPFPSGDGVCDIFDALIILAKAQGQIAF